MIGCICAKLAKVFGKIDEDSIIFMAMLWILVIPAGIILAIIYGIYKVISLGIDTIIEGIRK